MSSNTMSGNQGTSGSTGSMGSASGSQHREMGGGMQHEYQAQTEDFAEFMSELGDSVQKYCKRRPGVVAGVLFGLGFFCGWKLRPW
ncbi:MAG: hypothetical protein ACTHK7_12380 [Aureliella sp.]